MKKLLTIFILLFSVSGMASVTTAKIQSILVYEDAHLIYIYPEGGVNNPPGCHGSNGDYLSYKMDRLMADEYYSGLMAAFMAQKTVTLIGADACIDQPDISETLRYFIINH